MNIYFEPPYIEGQECGGKMFYGPVFRVYDGKGILRRKNIGMLVSVIKSDYVWIDGVQVLKNYRNQGIATGLMTRALRHFDDFYTNRSIQLKPDPYDDSPMSVSQLAEFYKKFEFKWCVFDNSDYMERRRKE